jgi:hypothetical protein
VAIEGYRVGQDGTSTRTTQAGDTRVTQQYAETGASLTSASALTASTVFNNQFSAGLSGAGAMSAANNAGTTGNTGADFGAVISPRTTQVGDVRVDQAGNPRVIQSYPTSFMSVAERFSSRASAAFTGPSAIMAVASPPHGLFYKTGGQWLHLKPYAKVSGNWVSVQKVFIRSAGAWQLAYES